MRYYSLILFVFSVATVTADTALQDRKTGTIASASAAAGYRAQMPSDLHDSSLPKTSQVLQDAGFKMDATIEDYLGGLRDLKPVIAFGYADDLPRGNLPLAMAFKEIIASQPPGAYERISLLAIENTAENSAEMNKIGCHAIPCLAYHVIVGGEPHRRVNIGGPGSQSELDKMVSEWRKMMNYMSGN